MFSICELDTLISKGVDHTQVLVIQYKFLGLIKQEFLGFKPDKGLHDHFLAYSVTFSIHYNNYYLKMLEESKTGNEQNLLFSFSIDRGGTFTDLYCEIYDTVTKERSAEVMKLLSVDPKHYGDAPTEGIRRILQKYLKIELPRTEKLPTD